MGTLEAIKVKILIMGEEQNPLTLRIELTSENDLFFHFNHNLDEHGFRQVAAGPDATRASALVMHAPTDTHTHPRARTPTPALAALRRKGGARWRARGGSSCCRTSAGAWVGCMGKCLCQGLTACAARGCGVRGCFFLWGGGVAFRCKNIKS